MLVRIMHRMHIGLPQKLQLIRFSLANGVNIYNKNETHTRTHKSLLMNIWKWISFACAALILEFCNPFYIAAKRNC